MDFKEQRELIKDYKEATSEFLDELDTFFLKLEGLVGKEPDPQLLGDILSILHTFKGNSGMMGYVSLQKYAHKMEDVFKALQSETITLNPDMVEFFMNSVNMLRQTLSQITPKKPEDPDITDEATKLEELMSENKVSQSSSTNSLKITKKTSEKYVTKKTDVIKVDFQRLDNLLNMIGELVIYQNKLDQIGKELSITMGAKGLIPELNSTTEHIGKIIGEIHEAIMKVRMLPIKNVFMRFPRFVRDLAKEKEKNVNIFFEGEETELDKTIIDQIGEPLIHIVRNAIDHGIESSEERKKTGKTPEGTIIIRAYQESNYIMVSVEDNGRGIDEERLREKAEKAGLITKDDISSRDLLDFIFLPGLSTSDSVSEISGRGIGMDIVKKSIVRINGNIEVESEKNVGTRFTIKLPLTLAIASALMVKVAEDQFAIPLASVVESIKISEKDIHLMNNVEVIKFRGKILPLIRLADFFKIGETKITDETYVVIVQSSSRQLGLIVDSFVGQNEIVIKALDDYLSNSIGVIGATIMGDGKVVLIIDVDKIMETTRYGGGRKDLPELQA